MLRTSTLIGALLAAAPTAARTPLDGVWRNHKNTVEVEVGPCGSHVCGTVVAARGDAIEDARKGGVSRLVGMRVMRDYDLQRDGSWRGTVFVPQLGRTLPSRIRLVDAATVKVTGCAFAGLICKTKIWRRVS